MAVSKGPDDSITITGYLQDDHKRLDNLFEVAFMYVRVGNREKAVRDKEMLKVLGTKTTKWCDELEWRYFLRYGNTDFPVPGTLEAIKLGKNMPNVSRQRVVEWVTRAKSSITIEK